MNVAGSCRKLPAVEDESRFIFGNSSSLKGSIFLGPTAIILKIGEVIEDSVLSLIHI